MIDTLNQLPIECFTMIIVGLLVVVVVVELATPKAVGPITEAINKTGSCFTYASIILALAALFLIAISGQR